METKNLQFSEVAKMIQPFTEDLKPCEVVIDPDSSVLEAYAKALSEVFDSEAPSVYTQGGTVFADVLEYLRLLIEVRVVQARKHTIKGVRPTDYQIIVPAFMNALLEQLGEVYSTEFGLHLLPTLPCFTIVGGVVGEYCQEVEDRNEATKGYTPQFDKFCMNFNVEKFFALARKIRTLCEQTRIVYAKGLPRSTEGNIEMMALQVVEEVVYSESNHAHPLFGIMAAVLSLTQMRQVTIPRVKYVDNQYAKHIVQGVVKYEQRSSGKLSV